VQTTHKIQGDATTGFAAYLTASTRGDYYLAAGTVPDPAADDAHPGGTADRALHPIAGHPAGAPERTRGGGAEGRPGKWHGTPEALAELGLSADRPVERDELVALMRGNSPATGEPMRAVGGNGTRTGGVDLTFSPPKSVSALWAVSSRERQNQIEQAHHEAVKGALERTRREVELLRTRQNGAVQRERAKTLVAAEFLHTASRLTIDQERGGVPDPQLHSHVVVVAGQRENGRWAAIESRELYRAARANGAWYRAELANNLARQGLQIEPGTGKGGRYFELKGVPAQLADRWSARGADVEQAARAFRERYGRDPKAGELSALTVRTRGTKASTPQVDVAAAWRAVGAEHGLTRARAESLWSARERTQTTDERDFARDLLQAATANRSTIAEGDLKATAYERAAGRMHPSDADRILADLARSGELIELRDGRWTTRELRESEQRTLAEARERRTERAAPLDPRTLRAAERRTEQNLGGPLSQEQRDALQTITGRGGVTVLVGQAGTGKGVVIGTATDAWKAQGYRVIGTAVAGATAKRLQADATLDRALTTDSLLAKAEGGRVGLDNTTVVVMDEGGMADTNRLAHLTELTAKHNTKLVLVGDSAQLSPIGAGGLFKDLEQATPSAELKEVRRARNQWERTAWQQIREGNATAALAQYQANDRLHIAETRQQAIDQMVADWNRARANHPEGRSVMLTDASNRELDEINAKAQQHRAQNGELGTTRTPLPDRPYQLAAGDQIIFTAPYAQPGKERVENGTTATIADTNPDGTITVQTQDHQTHGDDSRELTVNTRDFNEVRLAYAQHVYKAQGRTVNHALTLMGGWQTDRERAYVALTR
jgi:conjugative relaxase-like TrwC/TraI family protein